MKQAIHLILSLLVVILIAITCTEEPAGPEISEDLKPHGSITCYIYNIMEMKPVSLPWDR